MNRAADYYGISKAKRKRIAWWLWTGVGLVFLMLVIGGITRLTGSGLSMTDWNLIMGAFPPTSPQEWQEAFARYKQFPEYQQLNTGMSLDEFKGIFFWEYLHRMLGRFIGLVFLIPFLWFWIRGYFNSRLIRRMFVLFGLGALQAAMGWVMVKSGLVDIPHVSHYRLAAHLLLAFVLIGFCVWYALDLQRDRSKAASSGGIASLERWSLGVAALFFLQVLWGAFTAGLEAGLIYNTFPLMNGSLLPRFGLSMEPLLLNLVENPGTVQWMHRILGTLLTAVVIGLWLKARKHSTDSSSVLEFYAALLVGVILIQYLLGVLTVLYHVPVALGVIHQGVAMIFWIVWLIFHYKLVRGKGMLTPATS